MTVHRRRTKRRWLRWLLLLAVLDAAAFYWWWSNQAERRHNGIIREAAEEHGVEYALIKAVIWQESRFREDAVGDAGEIGLMQLMELADDPRPYALADYNAGRARVVRWASEPARTNSAAFLQNIDFPSTRRYIDQVTRRRDHYR